MYCSTCGFEIDENAKFCINCGTPVNGYQQKQDVSNTVKKNYGIETASPISSKSRTANTLICPKCGGEMKVQAVAELKKTGCLTIILYILLALTIVGLLIVIPLLARKKTKTKTYAVCQICGYKKEL